MTASEWPDNPRMDRIDQYYKRLIRLRIGLSNTFAQTISDPEYFRLTRPMRAGATPAICEGTLNIPYCGRRNPAEHAGFTNCLRGP